MDRHVGGGPGEMQKKKKMQVDVVKDAGKRGGKDSDENVEKIQVRMQ